MAAQSPQLRSLYRRLLRELPARQPSILANPSPLHSHIRSAFAPEHTLSENSIAIPPETADQLIQYLKAQRMYITLIERYNPGMNMDNEERVRLSARRIGMNLPVELMLGNKGDNSGGGDGGGQGGQGAR